MGLRAAIEGWGATREEVQRPLPCDRMVPEGRVFVRAVDIEAPSEVVFRWLCQLRVAPYSYDWIDNFGRRSPQRLTPGVDRLERGQRMVAIFRLADFVQGHSLTLESRSRLLGHVALTYEVRPRGENASRLVLRIAWGRPNMPLVRSLLPAGDLIMARRQLLNFKRLAESQAA
jgi:hypothetical protein